MRLQCLKRLTVQLPLSKSSGVASAGEHLIAASTSLALHALLGLGHGVLDGALCRGKFAQRHLQEYRVTVHHSLLHRQESLSTWSPSCNVTFTFSKRWQSPSITMADIEKVNEVEHREVNLDRTISQESGLSDQSHIDAFTPEEQRKIICEWFQKLNRSLRTFLDSAISGTYAEPMLSYLRADRCSFGLDVGIHVLRVSHG